MLTFKLLIENRKQVYHIIEKYNFRVIDYRPHYEIEFFAKSYQDFNKTYFEITNNLQSMNINYILSDHLYVPNPNKKGA